MNLKELTKLVGKKYSQEDEHGNFLGCLEPVYLLNEDIPRIKNNKEKVKSMDFCLTEIEKYSEKINIEDIKKADVIAFKYPQRLVHFGIYLGDYKMIHTSINGSMTINKVDLNNNRIIGIYRKRKDK